MESIFSDSTSQKNIWCYLIKTIKWNTGSAAARFRLKNKKKIKLKKLVRKLNKENAPPDGWKPEDKLEPDPG